MSLVETHAPPLRTAPDQEFEPLLDSEEAAALLKIHPKTLQKMARRGDVVAMQIGKLWRFRRSALNRWLEKIAGRSVTGPLAFEGRIEVNSLTPSVPFKRGGNVCLDGHVFNKVLSNENNARTDRRSGSSVGMKAVPTEGASANTA